MNWSLREKLRRDFVALLPSGCRVTSEYVHPSQIFNSRTESSTVKRSRWLRFRDFILMVVITAAFNSLGNDLYGQDGLVPLRLLTEGQSSSAQSTSLAAEFADRLEKNQIEIERVKSKRNKDAEESKPGEIELTGYMNADPNVTMNSEDSQKTPSSLASDFAKRLSDVEKSLKKRDDADAKMEQAFAVPDLPSMVRWPNSRIINWKSILPQRVVPAFLTIMSSKETCRFLGMCVSVSSCSRSAWTR